MCIVCQSSDLHLIHIWSRWEYYKKEQFFHVFFSHQHVQIITGPHEKKWCGKIFWGPFLNKVNFFKNYAPQWIFKIESWDFAYVIFSYRSTIFSLPVVENRKKFWNGTPYCRSSVTLLYNILRVFNKKRYFGGNIKGKESQDFQILKVSIC